MQKALHILQKYWGHTSFRASQWPVINAALQDKDVIALLPTGGGKSICFQIPALYKEGICIVISPLIALMHDQVNALKNKGIKAMALIGGISYADLDTALDNCIYGNFKFLYLSPERLQQELVQERIKQMNVNLFAVDEAHCISQWGHDFRPAYRSINLLKDLQPKAPFMGLTATATSKVVKDIAIQLQLRQPEIIQESFFRPNLSYNVLKAEDKNYRLLQLLQKKDAPAIIYVRSRKATVEITHFLNKEGFKAEAFHGGLKTDEKKLRLQAWLMDKKNIMVATSAFGMGIDKPNVRHVIHLNLPESLESYFQEAGRAGRDGKLSQATIITHTSDVPVLKNQFLSGIPNIEEVKFTYKKLTTYFQIAYGEGENTSHDFNFSHFCKHYGLPSIKTYNALQLLDRCGILKFSEEFKKRTELQFVVSGRQLQFFLEENEKYQDLVRTILRTYGGILENKTFINLRIISQKTKISEEEIVRHFNELQQQGVAEFTHSKHDATILFLVPREDYSTINPFSAYIKNQQKNKEANIESVLYYIENEKQCRSRQLLRYFGEKKTENCGICSVCNLEKKELTRTEMNEIYRAILPVLKNRESTSQEITENINYPEENILEVLRLLTEKNIIYRTKTNCYKIK